MNTDNEFTNDDDDDDDDEVPTLLNFGPTGASASAPAPAASGRQDGVQHNEDTAILIEESKESLPVVPVTILTGFLGSGKTTLIQYILRSEDHGKKIAIIENEFSGASAAVGAGAGAGAGIDDGRSPSNAEREGLSIETMIARDGTDNSNLTDLIELPNGCICCTVKDSLVETLEALVNKKTDLDYIIIECSGMANPGPIASIFWLDDALESRLRLDGIVACVDARNFHLQLAETTSVANRGLLVMKGDREDNDDDNDDDGGTAQDIISGGDEAAQQVAFADRIIVNKIDLLDDSPEEGQKSTKIQQVIQQIRAINATAPILKTTFSQVANLDWVLDANCFDIDRAKEVEANFDAIGEKMNVNKEQWEKSHEKCFQPNCQSCVSNPLDSLYCGPCSPRAADDHTHTNTISTIALIEKGSVNLKQMNTWLASILWPDQDQDDKILKAQLDELERLNQITTPELAHKRRQNQLVNQMNVFRIKGIISVQHDESEVIDESESFCDSELLDCRKFIVQAVNDLWEIHPANNSECWTSTDERICKVVLIGRNLKTTQLLSGFKSCLTM